MYQLRTTDSEIAVIAISGNSICKSRTFGLTAVV